MLKIWIRIVSYRVNKARDWGRFMMRALQPSWPYNSRVTLHLHRAWGGRWTVALRWAIRLCAVCSQRGDHAAHIQYSRFLYATSMRKDAQQPAYLWPTTKEDGVNRFQEVATTPPLRCRSDWGQPGFFSTFGPSHESVNEVRSSV